MRLSLQVNIDEFIDVKTFKTPKEFQDFTKGFMEFLAKRMVSRVKQVVYRQLYNWAPLSKTWRVFKRKMGLSPKKWYASGQIVKSIKWWHSIKYKTWFVGVNPTLLMREYRVGGFYKTKKTGTKMIDVIRYLEYGTRYNPARPLFTKVIAEFKRDVNNHYFEYVKSKK